MITSLNMFLDRITSHSYKPCIAVAKAEDDTVLEAVKSMQFERKVATFTLVGNKDKILAMADELEVPVDSSRIIDLREEDAIAVRATALVKSGEADVPMKGHIMTSTFLKAILKKDIGLFSDKDRIVSEISIYDKVWGGPGLQMATCCGICIAPDLNDKVKIINNAIALCHLLGMDNPRIACLCALEKVNPAMPDTVDAAVLSQMNRRGQITGGIVDGPFALDNAVSPEEARHKGLGGEVAGNADVLLMSDIRMGNVFHKSLVYLARKQIASTLMGPDVPVILTSRSDPAPDRMISIALAIYLCQAMKDTR